MHDALVGASVSPGDVDRTTGDELAQLRHLAELLAFAIRNAGSLHGSIEDTVEHAIVADGFLARAARAGLTLAEVERAYIRAMLHAAGGNKSLAARRLAINRRTLQRRLDGEAPGDEDQDDDADA